MSHYLLDIEQPVEPTPDTDRHDDRLLRPTAIIHPCQLSNRLRAVIRRTRRIQLRLSLSIIHRIGRIQRRLSIAVIRCTQRIQRLFPVIARVDK